MHGCTLAKYSRFTSYFAEGKGFEPLKAFTLHAFQACALDHYANPPK